MKRFLVAALIMAAAIAALVVLARILPTETAARALEARLSAALGLDVASAGEAQFSVIPRPALRLSTVSITTSDGHRLVTAEGLTARLALLPLLRGEAVATSVTLEAPDIRARVAPDGAFSWNGLAKILVGGRDALPDVSFTGGRLVYDDARDGSHLVLADLSGQIAMTGNEKLRLDAAFRWRNEKVEITARTDALSALKRGGYAPLEASAETRLGRLRFSGRLGALPEAQIDGSVAVDADAADRLAVWLAGEWDRAGWPTGALKLRAGLVRTPTTLSLNGLTVTLGKTQATGAITIKPNHGRPLAQGTLAADSLDLAPLLHRLETYGGASSGWSHTSFGSPDFAGMDAELRLSVDRMTVAGAVIENAAILTDLRNGALSVRLEEAGVYGGTVTASFRAAPEDSSLAVKVGLTGRDLLLARMPFLSSEAGSLEGQARTEVQIEGTGGSPAELTRTLSGQITVDAMEGAIHGINIAQGLRRLERNPLALREAGGGRTAFAHLAARIDITQGVMSLTDTRLESPDLFVTLGGYVNVAERTLDLAGLALRREDGTALSTLPFKLEGPWRAPGFRPDVNTLLRRSGAAAPLLAPAR